MLLGSKKIHKNEGNYNYSVEKNKIIEQPHYWMEKNITKKIFIGLKKINCFRIFSERIEYFNYSVCIQSTFCLDTSVVLSYVVQVYVQIQSF